MPNIIGSLLVSLGLSSASFEQGLSRADKVAKQTSKDVQKSLSDIGDTFERLLGPFGEIGGQISSVLQGIGSSAGSLLETFGPLAGAAGAAGAGLAAIAAIGIGAGIAAIGIAIHASEAAAKLEELSQSTGVSVAALSLLGNVAKEKGISIDSMAKALEKMSKSAVAAAEAGPKTRTAYDELGVAVKNADGSIRDAQDIFNDVSKKFAEMPDGPLKTAEAIKIFGRSGAELIPVLNEGGEKLDELEGHYKALGTVIDGPTAKASANLKEQMALMSAAFDGVENELVQQLVPSLVSVAEQFVTFFEQNHDSIVGFIDGVSTIAKVVINLGQIVGEVFGLIYRAVSAVIEEIEIGAITIGRSVSELAKGNFKGAWQEVKDGANAAWDEAKKNGTDAINSIKTSIEGIKNVWTASLPTDTPKRKGNQKAPGALIDLSFIDAAIVKYQSEEKAAEQAAEAIGHATEQTILAIAAAKAQKDIDALVAEATKKKIVNTKAFQDALTAAIPKIQQAALFTVAFNTAAEDSKGLEQFISKTNEQTKAYDNQTNSLGAVAREQAAYSAKLSPYTAEIEAQESVLKDLTDLYGAQDPRVQQLAARIDTLKNEYQLATDAVTKHNTALQSSKIKEITDSINSEHDALVRTTAALAQGGESYAKIDQAVAKFALDTGADTAAQEKFRQSLIANNAELQKQAALKLASPGTSEQASNLKIQITTLEGIRAEWDAQGKSVTGVDAALRQVNAEYLHLQAQAGGFQAGAKAGFADFAKDLQTSGELMENVISTGLKGISDNFASMVATGKASWQDLITSMEEMLIKSAISNILNSLFKSVGGFLSGQGGFLGSLGGILGGARAGGGDVTPGKAYLVGEKGPEWFTPSKSGTIIPNGQGGGGGQTIVQNWNISTPNADSFQRSQSQIGSAMWRQTAQAHARLR